MIGWLQLLLGTVLVLTWGDVVLWFTPPVRRGEVIDRYARGWARWGLWGNRIRIEGAGKIPAEGPVLFVANHQSNLDILLIQALLPGRFLWMSKEELFRTPRIGRWLRHLRAIEVHRQDRRRAAHSFRAAAEALARGERVVIFPEGTWGEPDGTMKPFKRGAAALVRRARPTVVPMTVVGTGQVNPPESRTIRHGMEMRLVIHDPIDGDTLAAMEDDEGLARLREIIGRGAGRYEAGSLVKS